MDKHFCYRLQRNLLLVKLPCAPPVTRVISLFLVPKRFIAAALNLLPENATPASTDIVVSNV